MSGAAVALGELLGERIGGAARARWFTTGVVATTDPLTVTVSGGEVPAATVSADYVPVVGQTVLVGVLRGEAASGYVVFGGLTTVPPAPPEPPGADYSWLYTANLPRPLSTDGQVYTPNGASGVGFCYGTYQLIQVDPAVVAIDPAGVLEVAVSVQYPLDPSTLDPSTLDLWLEAPYPPGGSGLYPIWHLDTDPDWPGDSILNLTARITYTGSPEGYWYVWVSEQPAFTESGALLQNFALAFSRQVDFDSTDLEIAVPDDATPVGMTVAVAGAGAIVNNTLVGVTIDHTSPEDLYVWLELPDASTVVLHDHAAGDWAGGIDHEYQLDLTGYDLTGDWTVWVRDDVANAVTGTYWNWYAVLHLPL